MNATLPEKTCAQCGRRFSWRKKWERDWEQVRYCSAACRRQKVGQSDQALEARILRALERAPAKGISLEALVKMPDQSEPLRQAARRLARDGRIEMIQAGVTIDPRDLHGRVTVRRPR